jgi:hypothetical protein
MPITRSYANAFEVQDYTEELSIIPNSWTLLNDIGLFSDVPLSTYTATFEEVNKTFGLIGDQYRGAKPFASSDYTRKIRSYNTVYFPLVDEIKVEDIQGKRAYGSQDAAESMAAIMARKLERINKSFDITEEVARFKTLTSLSLYAPNGTIAGNFATDFGVTQVVVDFDLTNAASDIAGKVETVIATMQDNAQTGDVITGIVGYCSPTFFASLIAHAKIQAAYQYYSATEGQSIMRNRAGGNGLYREFTYMGVRFIEVRTVLAGETLIPAGDCTFVPTGTTVFKCYRSPANKLDYVNTMAERRYVWAYNDPKNESISLEAQSSFLNVVLKPLLVVRGKRTA